MNRANEIWEDGKGNLSEEKLMAYLQGKLSADEQREVEQLLNEEGLESDAMEGLQALPNEVVTNTVHKLNKQLHHLSHKRKQRSLSFSENKWTWMAILIILLLAIVGYGVLHIATR